MSNESNKRVLGRMGAHELTPEQIEQVDGAMTMFTKMTTGTSAPFDLNNDI